MKMSAGVLATISISIPLQPNYQLSNIIRPNYLIVNVFPEALRPRPAGDLPGDEEGAVAGALHAVAREGHVIP